MIDTVTSSSPELHSVLIGSVGLGVGLSVGMKSESESVGKVDGESDEEVVGDAEGESNEEAVGDVVEHSPNSSIKLPHELDGF